MDHVKFRAWVSARQGLSDRRYGTAREALAKSGWQRSVGGVSPYLGIRARSGEGREQVDALAQALELFELPCARGCTYVVPADHFALGLVVGRPFGSATEVATARKLGVEDTEVRALKEALVASLAKWPLSPADLKTALGDKVRNLGEEGKKKGLTTTLPLALGLLQTEGRIRRKPTNGRLDTQRYDYERWDPPLTNTPSEEDAATELARLFFTWTGAATLKEFREFSAFTARAAQPACERAGLVSFGHGTELVSLPDAPDDFAEFVPPSAPVYRLVGGLDSLLLLRRGCSFWLDEADAERQVPVDKGMRPLSGLAELGSHAILDRGRLIGVWEFDSEAQQIVWSTWAPADAALRAEIAATEAFVRDELGDARSFSLDSPASRRPRLTALREMAGA